MIKYTSIFISNPINQSGHRKLMYKEILKITLGNDSIPYSEKSVSL